MTSDVTVLGVRLYDEPIGTLTHVSGDRTLFAFNDGYVDDDNRPTLGLGFKDDLGQLITGFKPVQTRVMPFFSNVLPEGRMRTYLADRAGVNQEREFFLLRALGEDLPGAVTIRPADDGAWPTDADDAPDAAGQLLETDALRFSLAGVQLKFSMIEDSRKGLAIPAKGVGGNWIVKLPSREFDGVPENEFSMMTLARLVGIDVPAVKLVDVSEIGNLPRGVATLEGQALVVERFDRLSDGTRVHIEDFAQVFGLYPEHKYDRASSMNLATVIGAETDDANIAEFVRRLTFNMLIGNADMHVKNWSLMYPDTRNAALAPAYDFVATIAYLPDDTAALKVSRTKRFDEFSEDELSHLAARARLPTRLVIDTARETVARFHDQWQSEKKNLLIATTAVTAIETHMKRIPLLNPGAAT